METTTQDLRREMVEACRQMNATGINQGTAGNLSVRTGDGFLITPSSLPYDRMQPEDLSKCPSTAPTPAAAVIGMAFPPRHPAPAHGYRRGPSLPLDLRHDARLPPQDHPQLPLHDRSGRRHHHPLRQIRDLRHPAAFDYALEALEDRLACLLGQRGQISLGKTLESALWLANEVETLSRMYVHALRSATRRSSPTKKWPA